MPTATSGSATRIQYDVHGAPTEHVPVVLLHGFGLSSRYWFDLPASLANDVARPRLVVTLDNRGTGRSDQPRRPYAMGALADDVAAVLDHAGLEDAVVVGISFGGMIAQHFALRHKRRTRGLVLLATTPGLPLAQLPPARSVLALLAKVFLFRETNAAIFDRLLLPERDLHRARELFSRWPAAAALDPFTTRACLAQLGAVLTHAPGQRLREIACPTVVVAGEEDVLIPPKNSAILAAHIPASFLELLPDIAHAVPMLDPHVIHRALGRIDAAPA